MERERTPSTSSGAKKPMPHTPMTPETQSIIQARAWRLHFGCWTSDS
jgi:hypothetical protein